MAQTIIASKNLDHTFLIAPPAISNMDLMTIAPNNSAIGMAATSVVNDGNPKIPSEVFYIEQHHTVCFPFVLCAWMKNNDGTLLMDLSMDSWKSMMQKGTKPVNNNFDEIMWHWVTFVKAEGIVKKELKSKA